MQPRTKRQKEILEYISTFIETRGYKPSYQQIAKHFRLASKAAVAKHITALENRDLVYDARNAVGGSGSPLFGQTGRVIGVNFATFTEMPDQNYAVPIRFAFPLLERAGWKPVEPADDNKNDNANSNTAQPKDARPNANQTR